MNRSAQKVLEAGRDDWVSLAELESYVREFSAITSAEELAQRDLEIITELVEGGFVEIGSVTEEVGFKAWDAPLPEALEQIRNARLRSDDWAWACWLANTELGNQFARAQTPGEAPSPE